jgi:outer membrane lipoprotein SlyB
MRSNHPRLRATLPALTLALLLAACGPQDGSPAMPKAANTAAAPTAPAAPTPAPRAELGTVTAVEPIVTSTPATGAGAVVGGVLGAAVGNQIGDGNGRKVATVLGAVGGAKVGHEVEKRRNAQVTGYRIDVKLDDGGLRSFTQASASGFSAGQRVRVTDGQLRPA